MVSALRRGSSSALAWDINLHNIYCRCLPGFVITLSCLSLLNVRHVKWFQHCGSAHHPLQHGVNLHNIYCRCLPGFVITLSFLSRLNVEHVKWFQHCGSAHHPDLHNIYCRCLLGFDITLFSVSLIIFFPRDS